MKNTNGSRKRFYLKLHFLEAIYENVNVKNTFLSGDDDRSEATRVSSQAIARPIHSKYRMIYRGTSSP